MNPLLFAGSIVVGYLAASLFFPHVGWATKKSDIDPKHPDRTPEINEIKKKGAKQIIPGLPITKTKNQCPGHWVESNGIVYCDSWTHGDIGPLGTRKSTKPHTIYPNVGPGERSDISESSPWFPKIA